MKGPRTRGVDRNMFSAATENSVVLPFRCAGLRCFFFSFFPFINCGLLCLWIYLYPAAAAHRPRFPSWKDPAAINVNTASRCFPPSMASRGGHRRRPIRGVGLALLSDSPPRHRRSERESLCADDSATDHTACVYRTRISGESDSCLIVFNLGMGGTTSRYDRWRC